jgi:hypothetical protein
MSDAPRIPSPPIVVHKYADLLLPLDPRTHKLSEILTDYHFDEQIPCGLANCRTPHNHGVLVLTEDGSETNIGHICGAKHFPEQFMGARKEFRRRQAARAHLDVIQDYLGKVSQYVAAMDQVMQAGGEWADRCLHAYRDMCPDYVKHQLFGMARTGDWSITREEKVDSENALALGLRRGARTETKVIGHLRGGVAIMKLVASVLRPIRATMQVHQGINPIILNTRKRREWVEWAIGIPRTLEEAQAIVTAAREFYAKSNLDQLIAIARDKHERRAIRSFIEAVESLDRSYARTAS